ncbi:hypothetical protein I8H89_00095 [Candidatus Saccharibacteria bacterium]|nr:hypothetical protein [Candidatus Saccharibacteria bacterium]
MEHMNEFHEYERGRIDFTLTYTHVKCPQGILPQLPQGSNFLFDGPLDWHFAGSVDEDKGVSVSITGKFFDDSFQDHGDFLSWIEVFEQQMNDAPIHLGKKDYFTAENRSFQIL